jgi:hypothetical protein
MKPIDLFIDQNAVWKSEPPVEHPDWKEGDIPYATHEGQLTIMGVTLRVARLNTGQSVFNSEDFETLMRTMGMMEQKP